MLCPDAQRGVAVKVMRDADWEEQNNLENVFVQCLSLTIGSFTLEDEQGKKKMQL